MTLHYEMVTPDIQQVLIELMQIEALSGFRLVGGTSLALQLGHRMSIDIDLFAAGNTPPPHDLATILSHAFPQSIKIIRVQSYGLTLAIKNIKVDIYDWKVPFVMEAVECDGLRMAAIEDIFAYKCEALMGRKEEKDFVDIAEICRHKPLDLLLNFFQKRYHQYSKAAVLAILLKPEAFSRDTTIQYAQDRSWDRYCSELKNSISTYERDIEMTKESRLKDREEKIRELIKQKRKKGQ